MLAWSEETITDVETRNHGYDVIVGEYLLITPITLANCHARQNSNQRKTGFPPASFPLVGCLPQAAAERLLEKSERCGIAAD